MEGLQHVVFACRAQRDYLQKKMRDCEVTLADAKADRKESERDRRTREAVTNLKRLFPGLLITHANLCEPAVLHQCICIPPVCCSTNRCVQAHNRLGALSHVWAWLLVLQQ